jgi:threonine dehydrogenase-like Zn-dependent dehydrogenase
MKALTWHGKRDVRVDNVPDPTIEEPTDAIVRITTTAICGSDLHLYEVMGPFMGEGDILGHEPMGIVEEVGSEVTEIKPGDRVVMPFQMSCGHCFMCDQGLQTQCETTQVRDQGMGAALFGYTKLYGEVAGGQAEFLRVPQAQYTHIKVPEGPPDEASSTSPTCCRPPGRRSSTPTSPTAGASACSASGRSATWPPGSRCTAATA